MLALFLNIVYLHLALVVAQGRALNTHSMSCNVYSGVLHLTSGCMVDEPMWLYLSSAGPLARCSHLKRAATLPIQPGLQCSYLPCFWAWVISCWEKVFMAPNYLSELVVWL